MVLKKLERKSDISENKFVNFFKRKALQAFDIEPYYDVKELIKIMAELIDATTESIKMLSGEYTHKVYEDEKITESIENALKRGVKIELIGGPEFDEESKYLKRLISENKIEYCQTVKRPNRHFRLFDNEFVGIEDPHKKNSDKRTGYFMKSLSVANELDSGFTSLKNKILEKK